MEIIHAPEPYTIGNASIFLAGSIEMGSCVDWQEEFPNGLTRRALNSNLTILNPRRKDFQPNAVQSINNPYFREQVEWEMEAIENCDILFMNLIPDTKSPISMMELGFILGRDTKEHLFVVCPKTFWRRGNVEIMLNTFAPNGLNHLYDSYSDAMEDLNRLLNRIL